MSIVAELPWLTDPAGAVVVTIGDEELLVVESDWIEIVGEGSGPLPFPSEITFTTPSVPGEWVEVFVPAGRQEASVFNNHSDPGAVVLVTGGPYGPKPIWPDGPGFITDWRGSIRAMSPTHSLVRCSGSQI